MPSTSWSVPRHRHANALKWREWDGDFVIFDPASGDTHFLNAVAGAVLKRLESQPSSLEEIAAHLEAISGKPTDDELHNRLRELIDRLDSVGLIERVRP